MTSKEYFPPDTPDLITTTKESISLTVMASTIAGFAVNSLKNNRSHLEVAVFHKMKALYPSYLDEDLEFYAKEGVKSAMLFIKYLGVFSEPTDGGIQ